MSDGDIFAGFFFFAFLYAIASLLTGLVGYAIAAGRGRGGLGFVLGFFFSFVGLIIAALLQPSPEELRRQQLVGLGVQSAPVGIVPLPKPRGVIMAVPGYCSNCHQSIKDGLCVQCGHMNTEVGP